MTILPTCWEHEHVSLLWNKPASVCGHPCAKCHCILPCGVAAHSYRLLLLSRRNLLRTDRTQDRQSRAVREQGFQLGRTKVFLRAGQMAQLDKLRTELMGASATTIQRHVRGLLRRRQYQRVRRATVRLQVRNEALHVSVISY